MNLHPDMNVAVFPRMDEFERMKSALDACGLTYSVISPDPGYSLVGCPAIAVSNKARALLSSRVLNGFICAGWVDSGHSDASVSAEEPPLYQEDIFGSASVMVVAPCVADEEKIRLIAHVSGSMEAAFPYLNTEMKNGSYNADSGVFSFMDGYRMVALYPLRISIARADGIIDGWRTLESIRRMVNSAWARRDSIEPSYEMKKKPPALEIYKRLPGTNCGECGEKTCMAFALRVWNGQVSPRECRAIFGGQYSHLKDAFTSVVSFLGFDRDAGI